MMFLSRVYPSAAPLIATIFFILVIVDCVTSRSIEPGNFTVDKSEVPARYVFEIDEVEDESFELDKSSPKSEDHLSSSLLFDMPIAVAIFGAVMLLVCCFCCLRCAVTYDGWKRGRFYGKSEKPTTVDIVRSLNLIDPIKK